MQQYSTSWVHTHVSQHAMRKENCNRKKLSRICKHFVGNTLTTFPNAIRRALLQTHFLLFFFFVEIKLNACECYSLSLVRNKQIVYLSNETSTTHFWFFFRLYFVKTKVCYGYMVLGLVFSIIKEKTNRNKSKTSRKKWKVKHSRHEDQFESEYLDWFGSAKHVLVLVLSIHFVLLCWRHWRRFAVPFGYFFTLFFSLSI